jgi:hypothetical protein
LAAQGWMPTWACDGCDDEGGRVGLPEAEESVGGRSSSRWIRQDPEAFPMESFGNALESTDSSVNLGKGDVLAARKKGYIAAAFSP